MFKLISEINEKASPQTVAKTKEPSLLPYLNTRATDAELTPEARKKIEDGLMATPKANLFTWSSDNYFREYKIPDESWFEKDKKLWYGKTIPLEEKTGNPKDYSTGKEPTFYTFYAYVRFDSDNG